MMLTLILLKNLTLVALFSLVVLIQLVKMIQHRAPNIVFDLKVPILGICYGMQTMAVQLGGEAKSSKKAEFGFAKIRARNHSKLLTDITDEINSQGHGL